MLYISLLFQLPNKKHVTLKETTAFYTVMNLKVKEGVINGVDRSGEMKRLLTSRLVDMIYAARLRRPMYYRMK